MDQTKRYTGMCTCPGTATGRIIHYAEGKTFTKADVVILNEFVTQNILVLKDVAAILSSTGGLTCHAAIIAREFNIPCMVKVTGLDDLKEGTEVKVDAAAEEVVIDEEDQT